MPQLPPRVVLRRFSRFTLDEIREAIPDDREFLRAQVGSMGSTLNLLAAELAAVDEAVGEQHRVLLEALAEVEPLVGADDTVATAVADATRRLEDASGSNAYELEREVLTAANDVFEAVDDHLDAETARRVRRPLYGFLDTRVETQLEMLRH